MSKQSVDNETAEREFARIAKARRLDTNTAQMTEKDRAKFLAQKGPVVDALMEGRLIVDEAGQPTLHLLFPVTLDGKKIEQLTFYRPKGATLTASDGYGENDRGKRMHAMLSQVCKTSPATFDEMDWVDHQVAQSLFALFLG